MSFSVVVSNSDYQVPEIIAVPFYEVVTEKPVPESTTATVAVQPKSTISPEIEKVEPESIADEKTVTEASKTITDVTATLEMKEEEVVNDESEEVSPTQVDDADQMSVVEPELATPISTKKATTKSTTTTTTTTSTTTTTTPTTTTATTRPMTTTSTTTQKRTTPNLTSKRIVIHSTEKLTTQTQKEKKAKLNSESEEAGMDVVVIGGIIGLICILGAIVLSFHLKKRSKLQKDAQESLNASLQSGKAESNSSNNTNGYLQMATEDPDLKSIRDDSLEPIDATHAHTDPTVTVSETQSFIPSANRVSEYKFDSS